MQDRSLTLYISGLLTPFKHVAGLDRTLVLEGARMFACRARYSANAIPCYEEGVLVQSGITDAECESPAGVFSSSVDLSDLDDVRIMRADPVFLQPNRDEIVMSAGGLLNIHYDEMTQLKNEFNRLFAEDGFRLETPVNDRWYLLCDKVPEISTTPIHKVFGKNIHNYLPGGDQALYWHGVLNEVQMLFYNSSVNQQRRAQGLPEISGVWLWGGGQLPEGWCAPWQGVWANDVTSMGIAKLGGVPHATLPEDLSEWLECADSGAHLVAFDAAAEALEKRNLPEWERIIQELDQDWIKPAVDAVRRGDVERVLLVTEGAQFELGKKELRRWWRRGRPLSSYGE